jgi:8-hydroxy-5-deazaflavin:NADPH oxidoreductase
MRIGIIGAGKIGATTARLFAEAGHDVAISNSRGPESLKSVVDDIGPRARAMTVNDAARFGDVVLLAVPWRKPDALPSAEAANGKIVIDAMNAYAEGGGMENLHGRTSSEHTRQRLPGARLVKAFNTMYYKYLAANGRKDLPVSERNAIFVAGDDADAKRVVMKLIEEIGFGPVDSGSLVEGGAKQQPGTPIYNRLMSVREALTYPK